MSLFGEDNVQRQPELPSPSHLYLGKAGWASGREGAQPSACGRLWSCWVILGRMGGKLGSSSPRGCLLRPCAEVVVTLLVEYGFRGEVMRKQDPHTPTATLSTPPSHVLRRRLRLACLLLSSLPAHTCLQVPVILTGVSGGSQDPDFCFHTGDHGGHNGDSVSKMGHCQASHLHLMYEISVLFSFTLHCHKSPQI